MQKKRNRRAPLRVLLAPCDFKENLLVGELIECMALGVAAAAPNAEILRAPMVDGGEGFTRTLVELTSGTLESVTVTGPVGQKISAEIGLLGGAHRGTPSLKPPRLQGFDTCLLMRAIRARPQVMA